MTTSTQPIRCTCPCKDCKAVEQKKLQETVQRAIAGFTKPKEVPSWL